MAIKISNTTVIADSRSLTNIVDVSSSGVSTLGTVKISNGIVTATSGVVTYYGDGKFLTGVGVGIQSGGQQIGAGITQLNFVGTGNTFRLNGNTVDVSISGAGSTQWITNNSGIVTTSRVAIGTDNARYTLEVGSVGASGTSLWVNGDARITGILTVGTSSILFDGQNNKIVVGTGSTISASSGFQGSGANLTNLSATNLTSGTIPDARFPVTLPSASGANLTSLNASNLSSGNISNSLFNSNSNAYGTRTVSSGSPNGGSDGDIWYQY